MSPLLRAELLKLRTTRTFFALTGSAVALSLLVVVLTTTLSDDADVRDLFLSDFTPLFILLLGVIGMAGEWRHRTITSTVLAAPVRTRLMAAKTLSYAVAGAVISFIVTVAIMAVGTVILSARDLTTLGAFGVCIGALVRNQIVAIVGLLVFSFALEPTLIIVVSEVGQFGPTVGAPNGLIEVNDLGGGVEQQLAPGAALGVMVAWVALSFTAGAALLRRRDLA